MQVFINDKLRTLEEATSLALLMEQLGHAAGYVAVAINQTIIKREAWTDTYLQDGDKILIIGAVKGG